ncbi:MAG: hypothetical protein RLZZ436_3480, partial [Planctomycetota bacterium]
MNRSREPLHALPTVIAVLLMALTPAAACAQAAQQPAAADQA